MPVATQCGRDAELGRCRREAAGPGSVALGSERLARRNLLCGCHEHNAGFPSLARMRDGRSGRASRIRHRPLRATGCVPGGSRIARPTDPNGRHGSAWAELGALGAGLPRRRAAQAHVGQRPRRLPSGVGSRPDSDRGPSRSVIVPGGLLNSSMTACWGVGAPTAETLPRLAANLRPCALTAQDCRASAQRQASRPPPERTLRRAETEAGPCMGSGEDRNRN